MNEVVCKLINDWVDAEDKAKLAIRKSAFAEWLIQVLDNPSKTPLSPTEIDPDYPKLRCYRGTGRVLTVEDASVREKVYICISTDWKGEGVNSFDEMNGCPGAPVRHRRHSFHIPKEFLENGATKKMFQAWADDLRNERKEHEKKLLKEKLKELE